RLRRPVGAGAARPRAPRGRGRRCRRLAGLRARGRARADAARRRRPGRDQAAPLRGDAHRGAVAGIRCGPPRAAGAAGGGAVKFGVILPGGTAAMQLDQAVAAESAGWDGVFVWEAAFGVDAWALLSAIAVRTDRVRLGTMLTPLPWRRPWKV